MQSWAPLNYMQRQMENIPLRWFKWGLAPKEKTHTPTEGRFIPTLLHLHDNQISFDTKRASKNTWAEKRRGNYWLLCLHSFLHPAACPGWLSLLWAFLGDLPTLGGATARVYVGLTDLPLSDRLVFADGVFSWAISAALSICLSLLSQYYTLPPLSVSLILSSAGSPKPY